MVTKGGVMEVREFESVLNLVDRQIDAAKKQRDQKARLENAERQIKLVRGRIASLEEKVAELASYGEAPLPQVIAAIAALKDEERAIVSEFPHLGAANGQAPDRAETAPPTKLAAPVTLSEKSDILKVLDEASADLEGVDDSLRILTVRVWALRWRVGIEGIGGERAAADRDVRAAYARIMGHVTRWSMPHVAGLGKDEKGDWAEELDAAMELLEERQAVLNRHRAMIAEIEAAFCEPQDVEKRRQIKHLIRTAGAIPSLRRRVAEAAARHRNWLGDEFRFLWDQAAPQPPPELEQADLSRRDIAARLLRRMLSKDAIGGCHVPVVMLHKGFPGDAQGTAKEAINHLAGAGVLRLTKSAGVGLRASIEPSFVPAARAFVEGKDFEGAPSVNQWVAEEGA